MSSQPKLSSRLSSLNMFGKFTSRPPPPVEKDPWYQTVGSKSAVSLAPSQALSMHASSIASMSVETLQIPQAPLSVTPAHSQCDLSRTMTPLSTRSRKTTMTAPTGQPQTSEFSSFRRGISKLSSSLGKKSKLFLRSNSSRTTLSTESTRASQDGMASDSDGDDSISRPWNVQHHLHVDEGLANFPPEWMNKLRQEGLEDTEVLSIHSRRNRTTYLKNHPDVSIDVLRARANNSPYTHTSTSASPNSLSPLPKSALPTRSTSLRRPTIGTSDNNSARSCGSSRSPDSTSPPSSYGFSLSGVPSDSSLSSRAPSLKADGDSDDCPDPGTATASQFTVSTAPLNLSRALLRSDSANGDPPSRTPPSRAATLTFVVTNPTPPSPPPAYDHSEPSSTRTQTFPRNEKHDPSASNDRRTDTSAVQQGERRSEETVTPEVLLRSETDTVAHQDRTHQSGHATHPSTGTAPPPFRLHLHKPSRDEAASPPPPESPVKRTAASPPRLSLHQDDLGSWSAELFSVISTPDPGLGSSSEASSSATSPATAKPAVEIPPTRPTTTATSPKTKRAPVPPLILAPAKDIPRVTIDTDDDETVESGSETVEHGAGTSTTPLFNEVLSLVRQPNSTTPTDSPPLTSTYPYLPSPPSFPSPGRSPQTQTQANPQPSPSHSPNATYEFLKEHYDPHRDSTVSSSAGSRESQATISASSRWSRATTVRDVREATIAVAHVRKPSIANAMTVPAPLTNRHTPTASISSTARSEGSASAGGSGSRPLSSASTDSACVPCASDFPLPPPSPGDFSISSVQPSPMSGQFSVVSDDVQLPYTLLDSPSVNRAASPPLVKRAPSPASVRSSQSSSRSGSSTSSSQVNPLSVTSGSDEHHGNTVRVELRYSEGGVLSPTDSTVSEVDATKWGAEQNKLSPPSHVVIAPRIYTTSADNDDEQDGVNVHCCDRASEVPDGASAVVEWLDVTSSPHPELDPQDKPIRDSETLYNLIGEPPRALLHSTGADKNRLGSPQMRRPSLQINGIAKPDSPDRYLPRLSPSSANSTPPLSVSTSPSSATPSPSPMERYCGWVSEVVAPLEEFIDHTIDPLELFTDLLEIAEGESGSVFSATVVPALPSKTKSTLGAEETRARSAGTVAVKQVPLLPGGSPKLDDLRKELMLMSRVSHAHILSMEALYVDLVDDALWIEMELMERSLADVLALAEEGIVLEEKVVARFTSDILSALAHLETLGIVHRDVRSDNLLVNSQGTLKLADFSNALLVDPAYPIHTDPAGVIYWQAPEMRSGSYDSRKVDIWSAGATAWEMCEAEPPFLRFGITDPRQLPDRWPALSRSDTYSLSFHDFLALCSNPFPSRPSADDLLMTPFIRSSCSRSLIVDLLFQCRTIEERRLRRTSSDSQGTILS